MQKTGEARGGQTPCEMCHNNPSSIERDGILLCGACALNQSFKNGRSKYAATAKPLEKQAQELTDAHKGR